MKLSAVGLVLAVLLQAAFAQTTVTLSVYAPSSGNIQYQEKPIFSTAVNPTAAGVVTVYVDGNSIGSCQIAGTATSCNVTNSGLLLTVGNHEAYSSYSATGGTTTNSSQVVFKVYAITILTTTSNPAGPNVAAGVVTFTVTTQNVPSTINGPTGTITFIDASHNQATIGTCLISNVASCSVNATLSPGTNYTVFASYSGDATYDTAFSASVFLVVGASTSTTGTTVNPTTATTGTTVNPTTATTGTSGTSTSSGNQTVTSSTSSTTGTTVNPTTATSGTTVNPTTATSGTTVNPTITTGTTVNPTTGTTVNPTITTGTTVNPTTGSTGTPTPAPTTGAPTTVGPTTGQITTSNATSHPTASPTKAPTSAAALTIPCLAVSAVLAVVLAVL